MKKLLISIVAVIVVLVAAALVAPSFIDWNAYRTEITAEVRKATGRALFIDGSIDVALLPAPKLTLTKARLANIDGANAPDMMRLQSLDVRVALFPLITGQIVVNSVVLNKAEITLERLADGRTNWAFADAAAPGPATAGAPPAKGGGAVGAVRLEQVRIIESRVTYRDATTGTSEIVEGIDALIAAASLEGPFGARGKLRTRGIPVTFDLATGAMRGDRPAGVKLNLEVPGAKASAAFQGSFVLAGAKSRLSGKIDAAGPDLAALIGIATGNGTGPAALGAPFSVKSAIEASHEAVAADDLTLTLGEARMSGAINAGLGAVPQIDVALNAGRVDLDAVLTRMAKVRGKAKGLKSNPGRAPAAGAGEGFALPKGIRGSLDVQIGGLIVNKGAVRNLRVAASLARGVARITRASALLPGGSEVSFSGRLGSAKGAPRFDGMVKGDSGDVRGLLAWLGVDAGAIAPDRLRKVQVRSGIGFVPDRIELRDVELAFDSTKVTGGVVVALRDRLGVGANIAVDRINLDAYLPKSTATAGTAGGKVREKKRPTDKWALAGLGAFDLNLRGQIDRMTWRSERFRAIDIDATLVNGDLTLRKVSAGDFAGAKARISGRIAAIDSTPLPDLKLDISTAAPKRLAALVGMPMPPSVAKLAPLALKGRIAIGKGAGDIDLALNAGAARLGLKGRIGNLATMPSVGLDMDASHPDFVQMMRLFDPEFSPQVPVTGPFALAARIDSAGLDAKITRIKGRFGNAEVTGTAQLALAGIKPRLVADLKAGEVVAGNFIPKGVTNGAARKKAPASAQKPAGPPWSNEPLELAALKALDADIRLEAKALTWKTWKVDDPRLDITLTDGKVDLRRLSGQMVGGTFQMTGRLTAPAKSGGPAALGFDLDVARANLKQAMFNATDIDIADGTVNFRFKAKGEGVTSRALVKSLAGGGRLDAVHGAVSGFDLAKVNARLKALNEPASFLSLLETSMSGGTTRFSELSGTFKLENGIVRSNDVALKGDGGAGKAKLTIDLSRWLIKGAGTFRLADHPAAPPFKMRLSGPLDAPKRKFNVKDLQGWIASKAVGSLIKKLVKPQPQKSKAPAGTSSGTGSAAPPTPQSGSGKKPGADEFIRGIFDALKKN